MNEPIKIVANPSLRQIGFSFTGILFFSSITFHVYHYHETLNKTSAYILFFVLLLFFGFCALWSLYVFLTSKKIILTDTSLTIAYPLLFRNKNIDFTEVKKVREDNYSESSYNHGSTSEFYKGKKTTIELFESKNIVITSFEIINYETLSKNLRNINKSYFKLNVEKVSKIDTQGYAVLIFVVIVTYCLFMAIIL